MRRPGALPWIALAVVGAWCASLQGWAGARALGTWTPDLLLVLYFAVAPRLDAEGARFAAVFVALARAGFSIDPPVAVFAGYLGVAGVHGALRSTLDLEGALARPLLAALSAGAVGAWLFSVHAARAGDVPIAAEPFPWRVALATGLATPVLAPLLTRLPVLRRLESPRRA